MVLLDIGGMFLISFAATAAAWPSSFVTVAWYTGNKTIKD